MTELALYFGGVVILAVAAVGGIVAAAIGLDRIKRHIERQDKRNEDNDDDRRALDGWRGTVDEAIRNINKNFEKIFEELGYLRKRTDDIANRLPAAAATSQSPIRLTELGERISRDAGVRAWVAEHVGKVRQETEGMAAYDVQQHCLEYARFDSLDETHQQLAKDAAFKSGLAIDEVMRVYGIELRDEILSDGQVQDL